jgi:acetoacetate decarboxylase
LSGAAFTGSLYRMLHGYTTPRTPRGLSSLAPTPPWHYTSTSLAIEYTADPATVARFVPSQLEPSGDGSCAVYFAEWQFATDEGEEYLDPVRSQYKETIFLIAAKYHGEPVAFCPFIFVDQDVSLMRGLIQGWPKQFGTVWMTHASTLPSKAAPLEAPGGRFGATLSVRDRRIVEARVTLREQTTRRPSPTFARGVNIRYFPQLAAGRHDEPAVHELVRLKSRNVQFSEIWTGDASLSIAEHPHLEVADLAPVRVGAGFRFSFAFTVDDIELLEDLRKPRHRASAHPDVL